MNEPSPSQSPTPSSPSKSLWQITRPGNGLVVIKHANAPQPQPENWLEIFQSFIQRHHHVKVVGAKRYALNDRIYSMGEFLIHPKGFHHLGKGVQHECYRFPEEVDAIASGIMAVDEKAFDQCEGDKLFSALPQLAPLAMCTMIRIQQGRCITVPQVVITDEFSPAPSPDESNQFREIFGFDWLAVDMRDIEKRYENSGLLWNVALHAGMMPFEKYDRRGALVWEGYAKADPLKQRCDFLTQMVKEYANKLQGPTVDIGCGDGLFSHLFAMQGLEVNGIDPEPQGVAVSTEMCGKQTYPPEAQGGPTFKVGRGDAIPFDDNHAACATLFDVIEHLANPIQILHEISRVLKVGGHLICVTPSWQYGGSSDPIYHGFEYTAEELARQINATGTLHVVKTGNITGVYRDIIAVAQKVR